MEIRYYEGRFGEENYLFDDEQKKYIPRKGDFIHYNKETYKVLYVMLDIDYNVINVFVRQTIEEDF